MTILDGLIDGLARAHEAAIDDEETHARANPRDAPRGIVVQMPIESFGELINVLRAAQREQERARRGARRLAIVSCLASIVALAIAVSNLIDRLRP